jgi:hypothetical protein
MLIKVENLVRKLGRGRSPLAGIIAALCLTLNVSAFSQDSLPQLDLDLLYAWIFPDPGRRISGAATIGKMS